MKTKQLSLSIILLLLTQVKAQTYQALSLSGFNADVIANGIGASVNSTNASLDKDSDNYAFISKDFQVNSGAALLNYGLPENGLINSVVAATSGLSYQLASYSSNNSLRLPNTNDTGTLILNTAVAATHLYILAVSGSGPSTGEVTITFQDGTTQVFGNVDFQDWYGGTNYAIQGIGRIHRATDNLDSAGGTNPRIYQISLDIDPANQSKLINSLTFRKTSTDSTVINIFAISAESSQLSVFDVKLDNDKMIYPNPFSNELSLANSPDIISIDVTDVSGRTIKKNIQPAPILDFSFLERGTYILILKNKNGKNSSRKIIKK